MASGGGSGLIWGRDFSPDGSREVERLEAPVDGTFRWLHFNLADNSARLWIETSLMLPPGARELLLASDVHQRSLVEHGALCCILHDLERDFDVHNTARIGALHVAMLPDLMVTARLHPLGCVDIVTRRLKDGTAINGPASAFDLLVSSLSQNFDTVINEVSGGVQAAEDHFLAGRHMPTNRQLLELRRRLAQIHRMLDGTQRVFRRLEQDEDLPAALHPTVEKLSQRIQGLNADAHAVLGQLRLLRDELDLQSTQRTNQNLYLLSTMTALLLPATLVTGLFGMNTGGLPFTGANGTLLATGAAAVAALATYLFLRGRGFFS